MTTPDSTKQARFSSDAHAQLMALGAELGGTADDALRHLLGLSTVRVPVTEKQRRRWEMAAHFMGVAVDDFVRARVEASLGRPDDHEVIKQIFYRVDALTRAAGIGPDPVDTASTDDQEGA